MNNEMPAERKRAARARNDSDGEASAGEEENAVGGANEER